MLQKHKILGNLWNNINILIAKSDKVGGVIVLDGTY